MIPQEFIDVSSKFFYPCRKHLRSMIDLHSSIHPAMPFRAVAVFILPLLASKFVRLKPALPVMAAAFLVLQAANWRYGINLMKIWQSEDKQLIAATRFIDEDQGAAVPAAPSGVGA